MVSALAAGAQKEAIISMPITHVDIAVSKLRARDNNFVSQEDLSIGSNSSFSELCVLKVVCGG
jgi:hypothetical protein